MVKIYLCKTYISKQKIAVWWQPINSQKKRGKIKDRTERKKGLRGLMYVKFSS